MTSVRAAPVGSGGTAAVALRASDASEIELRLGGGQWPQLLPMIERVLARLAAERDGREIALAAYHLKKVAEGVVEADGASLVILEPDWLVNVTDLTEIEYCPRGYLIGRFELPAANKHITRGNIVHRTYEQMVRTPQDDAAIAAALKQAFFKQARDMALLQESKATMWDEVKPHHLRLRRWVRSEHLPATVRSESFLLAPQLGLKGRIDRSGLTHIAPCLSAS